MGCVKSKPVSETEEELDDENVRYLDILPPLGQEIRNLGNHQQLDGEAKSTWGALGCVSSEETIRPLTSATVSQPILTPAAIGKENSRTTSRPVTVPQSLSAPAAIGKENSRKVYQPIRPARVTSSQNVYTRPGSYMSQKHMIINHVAGQPHFIKDPTVVEDKLEQIREDLEGHNNENVNDEEKEYFIEAKCWDHYFPNDREVFGGRRPRNAKVPQERITSCSECELHGKPIIRCPWNIQTSCAIFDHKTFNVRFGNERFAKCLSARRTRCKRQQESRCEGL